MKSIPTFIVLLVYFFLPSNLLAFDLTIGPSERLVKIYSLPSGDRYLSSDARHYDLGFKYETFDVLLLPIYVTDDGSIVGYINSSDYERLSDEGIVDIIQENKITDIQSYCKIPFWDRWGGKLVLLIIILSFFGLIFYYRKKSKVGIGR